MSPDLPSSIGEQDDDLSPAEQQQIDADGRIARYAVDNLDRKVRDVLVAVFGTDAAASLFSHGGADLFQAAFASAFPDTASGLRHDVAFHLSDWRKDAARLLAVVARPDLFAPLEVRHAVLAFLLHAPNHVVAAARLSGYPVSDVFSVGPLVATPEDDEGEGHRPLV